MNCPKCLHHQDDSQTECNKCGIIFDKYYQLKKSTRSSDSRKKRDKTITPSPQASILHLLLYTKEDIGLISLLGRTSLFIGMLYFGIRFMISPIEGNYAGQSFMHLINLPFHEAGHIFLRPFGSLITSLGGSLFQLLVPLVCLFTFLVQTRDTFGASVALWWFGQNFFDLAPYINDARSLSLPLVGGNFGHSSPYGFHDWEYILTETGLLRHDHTLAAAAAFSVTLIVLAALSWSSFLLYKQFKNLE